MTIYFILEYLKEHPIVKIVLAAIVVILIFIFLVRIFSRFLQDLDYLAVSLKRHFKNLFRIFFRFIKWLLRMLFLPFALKKLKNEYEDISYYFINNSRFKDEINI